ncbi:MAG: omptin family outer membrane protease [Patescibacteria group bacterium]|nr:omptin family outer membrane protease [Patescibacteria group bacterium]
MALLVRSILFALASILAFDGGRAAAEGYARLEDADQVGGGVAYGGLDYGTALDSSPLRAMFHRSTDRAADIFSAVAPASRLVWSFDYRVRSMFSSSTAYEFGTPEYWPNAYAPISRLDFSLDSTWHGLRVGVGEPEWRMHVEWLTPMSRKIHGVMADYDWNINEPRDDPSRLDLLTHSSLRWNDGQMLEWEAAYRWTDSLFARPLELWPLLGFRFQRFNMTAYGIDSLVPPTGPDPDVVGVPVIDFNQQYYVGYAGAQLRSKWFVGRMPVDFVFQGDLGPAAGYNVDHHLLREGNRYTMERTSGLAWHLSLGVEAALTTRFVAGLQADYVAMRTTGTHRWVNEPFGTDMTWRNGVLVTSHQTSLTVYLRACF